MSEQSLLGKIKSKYVLQEIFKYIKTKNYNLKLFVHSNLFQEKLNLKILNYQEAYINQFGMDLGDYLCLNYNILNEKEFDKDSLKKKLENDILENNLDYNLIQLIVLNYFENFVTEIKENNLEIKDLSIDIFSPFFDTISKTEAFELFIEIPISIDIIEKFNLKEDYKIAFDKLNKSNVKYSIINCDFNKIEDINYLKEFQINFSHIKRLTIVQNIDDNEKHDFLFKTLFSFNNIENNLVYLNIKFYFSFEKINPNSMENLNNFKSLEKLILTEFIFETTFKLKLKNLKEIKLYCCENILFDEDIFLNLKILVLEQCKIEIPNNILKLPELEQLNLEGLNAERIFDFTTIKKLKYLTLNIETFSIYENNSYLENAIIYSDDELISSDKEKEMIQKLISINTLKTFDIDLLTISDEEIANIQGENKSVIEANINWNNNNDCIIFDLQKKFPNITKLTLSQNDYNLQNSEVSLEIRENKNSKINKLKLKNIRNKNTKLYCQSYKDLVKVNLYIEKEINNLKQVLPIFSDNCKIIFESLKTFRFEMEEGKKINFDILKNIYNNINKMPKLKKFILKFIVEDLEEEFYKKFVEKILLLKLYNVHIDIKKNFEQKKEYYLEKDFKEIFPKIKFDYHYKQIYIQKFIK